jgi:Caspase domain
MLDHAPLNLAVGGDKADDGSVTGGGSAARTCARNLPVSTIASFLSKQLGQEVSPTRSGIAGAQANFFGGDASKLAMRFAASQMKGGGGAGGNPLATLLGGAGGGGGGGAGMAVIGGMAASALAASGKGGKSPLTAILSELGLSGVKSATAEGAPPYEPTDGPLCKDVGVLITGCESDQTSADVRPPGGKPHGALTNAIKTVYNRNPNASYTQLILDVRAELHKSGFSQNPQLECAPNNADLPFICPGGNPASEADEGFNGGGKFKSAGSSEAASPSGGQEAPSGAGALSKLFKACFKG